MKFIVKVRRTLVEEAEFVVEANDADQAKSVARLVPVLAPWGVVSASDLSVVSVDGGCTDADHDAIKADPARWAAETVNRRPLLTDAESPEIAECAHCNSTLTTAKDEESR